MLLVMVQDEVADLKARITKAKRQLLGLKGKLGEATTVRDAALADAASLRLQLEVPAILIILLCFVCINCVGVAALEWHSAKHYFAGA